MHGGNGTVGPLVMCKARKRGGQIALKNALLNLSCATVLDQAEVEKNPRNKQSNELEQQL